MTKELPHTMIEVPIMRLLSPEEYKQLPHHIQSLLVSQRAARFIEGLYQNYLTRHLAARVSTFNGVLYIKYSVNNKIAKAFLQSQGETVVTIE